MAQRLHLTDLPERPLDAAAAFASRYLSQARASSAGDLVLLFAHADHTHENWRRAAVEELAREAAPARVNGVVGGGAAAQGEVIDYLDRAPGVTGQVFVIAGATA